MKRALLAAGAVLILVPGAVAASPAARTLGTRGAVESISADGGRVAIHARLGDDPRCDFGSLWQPGVNRIYHLGRRSCPQSSDAEFDALTVSGDLTAWTNYEYGNHAYCVGPYVATLRPPRTVATGGCPEEPDNEDLYWEYKGSGGLLVARSWTQCESSCDKPGTYDASPAFFFVTAGGLRRFLGAKDDTKLLDVDARRILLLDPAGADSKLLVLNAAGTQIDTLPVNVKRAWLDGRSRVLALIGRTLTTFDIAGGRIVETGTVKKGATIQDVENGYAVYFAGNEVHLLTIATNADRVVARQRGLVEADLEPHALFYAYNVPGGGAKPGRVTYLPLK
jgi:hypothetical protein